jgi:hypothetical protein
MRNGFPALGGEARHVAAAGEGRRIALCAGFFLLLGVCPAPCNAQASTGKPAPCKIEATTLDGWKAQRIANQWVTVTIVPQLGGRVMQVTFGGPPYLFVNSRFKGQYFRPSDAAAKGRWINYGGDKIWPLPTAGGLVFFGDSGEAFEAVEAKTGAPVWDFTVGQSIHASPMSYSVLGKQYVAVAAGTDVFTFALP